MGDLNLDGSVTSIDSNLMIKYLCGVLFLEDESYKRADINFDESITSIDSNLLVCKITGTAD